MLSGKGSSITALTGLGAADRLCGGSTAAGQGKSGRRGPLQKLKNIVAILTVIMWVLYGTLACTMAAVSSVKAGKKRNITNILLPVLFLMLHVSYGAGTIMGLMDKQERG